MRPTRVQAEAAILDLLAQRPPGKTICPSDAARALGGDDGFRPLMPLVRDAARALMAARRIEVTQSGEPVDLDTSRGAIRLRALSLCDAAAGYEGLLRLARAWHTRVMADAVVSHAFSHGFHPEHSERLAAYWVEALGGPPMFSEAYGDETSVVRIHSGNGQHEEMDRRAIACFDQALEDVGFPAGGPLHQALHAYFSWATTTTMARYHRSADDVPDGFEIPRWSWDRP